MDSHITRGQVLVGDTFNKVGAIDYWSTSTLDIKGNDMKKFKVGTKLIACEDLYVDDNLCLSKGNIYTIETVDKSRYRFHIIDEEGDAHCFDFSDVPNVWFNFAKPKKEKLNNLKDKFETPKHYNNDNGTLYKVATERGWNSYIFDIVKRLERAEKKGEFKTDLEKSKIVIDLWLKESEQC
jgi:hypothetical protein